MTFKELTLLAEDDFMAGMEAFEREQRWQEVWNGQRDINTLPLDELREHKDKIMSHFRHFFPDGYTSLPEELQQEWRADLVQRHHIPLRQMTPKEQESVIGMKLSALKRGPHTPEQSLALYKAIKKMSPFIQEHVQEMVNRPISLTYGRSSPLVGAHAFVFDKEFAIKNSLISSTTLKNITDLEAKGYKFDKVIKYLRHDTAGRWSTYLPGTYEGKPVCFARIETSSPSAGQTKMYFSDMAPVAVSHILQRNKDDNI